MTSGSMTKGSTTAREHRPVLAREAIDGLRIRPSGRYIDATFGRGGHSRLILDTLDGEGRLLAIDRDPAAVATAEERYADDPRVAIEHGSFGALGEIAARHGFAGRTDGLLLDLGVSSPQLDDAARGFSFLRDGPLDMRMDPSGGITAAEWLASASAGEIRRVLQRYGEERQAGRIARAIVEARTAERAERPLQRTGELAALIASLLPRSGGIHPATRSFQAIRMHVNDELGELRRALAAVGDVLRAGGRLCVISFHSLEDRIVKRWIREASREAEPWRGLPEVPPEARPTLRAIGRPIGAGAAEIAANPRARSARLRIAERLA